LPHAIAILISTYCMRVIRLDVTLFDGGSADNQRSRQDQICKDTDKY